MQEHIGIIAGGGKFPRIIAENLHAAGHFVAICGFAGHTDQSTGGCADSYAHLHLGQLGKMITFFKEHNVTRACMAGSISKPKALDFRPDWRAAKIIFSLKNKGDDSLLRAIINELEKEGIHIVSSASLAQGLLCPSGVLTRRGPTENEWKSIRYGWPIAHALGSYDIGQCIVVKESMVVAVECLEGTDATLERGGMLGGNSCIAIKIVKPGQDERVDLPSIGLGTVKKIIAGHYSALAVEAEKTLFFDREEALHLADEHGLCIIALPADFS